MTKSRHARGVASGVLFVVTGLLAASGILRLVGEAGPALAKEVSMLGHASQEKSAECAGPDGISDLLQALQRKEQDVAQTETLLQQREAMIVQAQDEIDRKIAQLERAETALRSTVATVQSAAQDDVARLTAVYENMKPKDAAVLFETMAPDFAAGFIGRMRPDAAAALMAGLAPEKAYSISVILAGRNANAPQE